MRHASYRRGVEWIALNDEAGSSDAEDVAGYISTLLLADLFGVEPERVARDVVRYRENELKEESRRWNEVHGVTR